MEHTEINLEMKWEKDEYRNSTEILTMSGICLGWCHFLIPSTTAYPNCGGVSLPSHHGVLQNNFTGTECEVKDNIKNVVKNWFTNILPANLKIVWEVS